MKGKMLKSFLARRMKETEKKRIFTFYSIDFLRGNMGV